MGTKTLAGETARDFIGELRPAIASFAGQVTVVKELLVAIAAVNDAPVLDAPYADLAASEDVAFDFAIAPTHFSDVDGDVLILSVRQANGDPLPAWASFADGRLTGRAPADFSGALELEIVASDGELTASDFDRLIVAPVNDRPVVSHALADETSGEDATIDFALPADAFSDPDGDALALTATLASGGALPEWLTFADGRFAGTPPQDFNGALDIEVMATDGQYAATDVFRLTIEPANDAPWLELRVPDDA